MFSRRNVSVIFQHCPRSGIAYRRILRRALWNLGTNFLELVCQMIFISTTVCVFPDAPVFWQTRLDSLPRFHHRFTTQICAAAVARAQTQPQRNSRPPFLGEMSPVVAAPRLCMRSAQGTMRVLDSLARFLSKKPALSPPDTLRAPWNLFSGFPLFLNMVAPLPRQGPMPNWMRLRSHSQIEGYLDRQSPLTCSN